MVVTLWGDLGVPTGAACRVTAPGCCRSAAHPPSACGGLGEAARTGWPPPPGTDTTQNQVTAVVTAMGRFGNGNGGGAHLPALGAARTGGSVPLKLQSPFPILPLPRRAPWLRPLESHPAGLSICRQGQALPPRCPRGLCHPGPPAAVPCSPRCGGRV